METADLVSFILKFPFQFFVRIAGGNDLCNIRIDNVPVAVLDHSRDVVPEISSQLELGDIFSVFQSDQRMDHMVETILVRAGRNPCTKLLDFLGNKYLLI